MTRSDDVINEDGHDVIAAHTRVVRGMAAALAAIAATGAGVTAAAANVMFTFALDTKAKRSTFNMPHEETPKGIEFDMMGRYDDGVYAHGTVLLVVFDRNLRFGIGTQIRHFVLFSAYHCQLAQQQVREVERERHVVVGFVTGVTEHHSLISGTLIHGLGTFYSPVDVGRLLVYGREYSAGVAVEFIFAACVPDAVDDAAGDFVQVDV